MSNAEILIRKRTSQNYNAQKSTLIYRCAATPYRHVQVQNMHSHLMESYPKSLYTFITGN